MFNSLYQVDWTASKDQSTTKFFSEYSNPDSIKLQSNLDEEEFIKLIENPSDQMPEELYKHWGDYLKKKKKFQELDQQRALIAFIETYAQKNPAKLYRAFEPLLYISRAEGDWTKVTIPKNGKVKIKITEERGESFFKDILKLQTILEGCESPSKAPAKEILKILNRQIEFINFVRNNIFHGSKTLGEIDDKNQIRRLNVYDLFLKGINSIFFFASGKDSAACDYVLSPICASSLPVENNEEAMRLEIVYEATARKFMMVGDARLIARFKEFVIHPLPSTTPNGKSALFYPSAGKDLLTPLLLGLPYCTHFYFFDKRPVTDKRCKEITSFMNEIDGLKLSEDQQGWMAAKDRHSINFRFNDSPRKLHLVSADNREFLNEDAELKFYFRRGDSSHGATGSGQEWDSAPLLPELLKKIPSNDFCIYLTDGEPGGFDETHAKKVFEKIHFLESNGRTYHSGLF
jgi:hypothetical protein